MKRQRLRSGILFVSFLLLPLTQFYFSPYIIIDGAIAGVVAGSAIVFSAQLFGALFLGRAFCGWVMPCGGMQEACFSANGKRVPGGRLNWIKWFIWVPWIGAVLFLFVHAGGVTGVDPLRKTHYGVSISEPWMYSIYYGVVTIFVILSFSVGRRASCHYICWMSPFMIAGRYVRNLLHLPALQLRLTGADCSKCDLCSKACPMSLDVREMVQAKRLENYECILCANCVDACKKGVLSLSFGIPEFRGAKGTPNQAPEDTARKLADPQR